MPQWIRRHWTFFWYTGWAAVVAAGCVLTVLYFSTRG